MSALRQYQHNGKRAPHKPLVVLMAALWTQLRSLAVWILPSGGPYLGTVKVHGPTCPVLSDTRGSGRQLIEADVLGHDEISFRDVPDVIDRQALKDLSQDQSIMSHFEYCLLCDDDVDNSFCGDRQTTSLQYLRARLLECSNVATTLRAPTSRSIAPPMPGASFPGARGMAQLAMLPS